MKKKILALVMGTSLVLAACGGADESAENDTNTGNETTTTAGAPELYKNNCAACHGQDLAGIPGNDLNNTGLTKEEIEKVIHEGQGAMPGGLLNDEEASQVAEWLTTKK